MHRRVKPQGPIQVCYKKRDIAPLSKSDYKFNEGTVTIIFLSEQVVMFCRRSLLCSAELLRSFLTANKK